MSSCLRLPIHLSTTLLLSSLSVALVRPNPFGNLTHAQLKAFHDAIDHALSLAPPGNSEYAVNPPNSNTQPGRIMQPFRALQHEIGMTNIAFAQHPTVATNIVMYPAGTSQSEWRKNQQGNIWAGQAVAEELVSLLHDGRESGVLVHSCGFDESHLELSGRLNRGHVCLVTHLSDDNSYTIFTDRQGSNLARSNLGAHELIRSLVNHSVVPYDRVYLSSFESDAARPLQLYGLDHSMWCAIAMCENVWCGLPSATGGRLEVGRGLVTSRRPLGR